MSAAPPTRHWTPQRIEAELASFLADHPRWPTFREFERAGRRGLREALARAGGARHWAARLGVPYEDADHKPGYATIWTEERIRTELERFLAGRSRWPTRKEFEAAGQKLLRDAVQRSGGAERWAAEFKLPRADRRAGSRRVWTEERIEAELRELIGEDRGWPSTRAFLDAGRAPLLAAVYAWGGPQRWSRRLGVEPRPPRQPERPRKWTEERVRAELARFCAGRRHWPRFREFERAGQGALYRAASRYGGVERWRREMRLER